MQIGRLAGALTGLEERVGRRRNDAQPGPAALHDRPEEAAVTAMSFRNQVADFEREQHRHRDEADRAAAEQRQRQIAAFIGEHLSDESWRHLLQQARQAAGRGETEFLLLRFPSAVCADDGRAVNIAEPGWPATLRGEAAEIHLRWQRDLRPHGFHLGARVLDFPGGKPGDIGLFLVWGR